MKISGILKDKGMHAFDHEARTHNGHIIPRVWVVAADTKMVHIWRKGIKGLQEIACVEFSDYHHDKHDRHKEMHLVEQFSEWLAHARDQDVFDRIILVAPKKMIGAFREYLPTDIIACIAAEISKDFAHMDKRQLEDALQKIIVI